MSPALCPDVAEYMGRFFLFFFTQQNSQFPGAKLPLPEGSEVSCGFRLGSNISEPPLKPHSFPEYANMATGKHQQGDGGGEKQRRSRLRAKGS